MEPSLRDFTTPNMWVPFMYVFYQTEIKQVEMPALIRSQDRLTVLDLLYNLGTPHGHQVSLLLLSLLLLFLVIVSITYKTTARPTQSRLRCSRLPPSP